MLDHWMENGPPVYISVASYLGLVKENKAGKPKAKETGDLNELLKLAGPGGMIQ